MEIELVKGSPFREYFEWWRKKVLNTAYSFRRDGKLHYIATLRHDTGDSFDEKRLRDCMADYLRQLRRNGFRYFCHHSRNKDIFEFIDFIKKNGYTIDMIWKDVIAYYDQYGMYEFHGNLVEYSAAFQYQIYDTSFAEKIKELIKDIPVHKRER